MFDLRSRQAINRGFSDAFGRGIDLALTPVVCGALGWGLDSLVGTFPVFTILFATLGTLGTAVKIKLGYDRQMSEFDDTPATRRRQVQPTPVKGFK